MIAAYDDMMIGGKGGNAGVGGMLAASG